VKWKWPTGLAKWRGVLERYKYVLLVIAAGLFLLLLPTAGSDAAEGMAAAAQEEASFQLEGFERQLEEILSRIEGAGETHVVLTLKNDGRRVLAQDSQRGSDGSLTTDVVTVGRGSGNQDVVEVQTYTPEFQGALVVCPGGEDPQVQLRLLAAVSALTGLGSDKISICRGN